MFDLSKVETLKKYESTSDNEIKYLEAQLGLIVPDIYKYFLKMTNGIATNYAVLYGTSELVERNETNEVYEYAPGYICIGDDNGGYVLLMEAKSDALSFRIVDVGYMQPEDNDTILDFLGWINDGCKFFY